MKHPDLSAEPYAIAEQVSPLVRRVLAYNPSPFSYTGTQTYIVGSGEVAVIDPGPLGDDPHHVDALIRILGDETITAIMCTHTHRDHSPAAAPLKAATGAPIIGCALACISCQDPSQPIVDVSPLGDGLKVIGYALVGAAVLGVLGKVK